MANCPETVNVVLNVTEKEKTAVAVKSVKNPKTSVKAAVTHAEPTHASVRVQLATIPVRTVSAAHSVKPSRANAPAAVETATT